MYRLTWQLLNMVLTFATRLSLAHRIKNRSINTKKYFRAYIKQSQQETNRTLPTLSANQPIEVSIIIPVYNQWHLTRACINAILRTSDSSIAYEILLADDGSSDETCHAAQHYPGLRVIRSTHNQGFIRNCNAAAPHAQGRYILLLNNDTLVLPNWLSALHHTMTSDPTTAIVGSKILYAKGTIQEAGATLFQDGSDCHIGRGFSSQTPVFNLKRETDCISGCSILIRRSFWIQVGGFDERYENAYFEDYDLAMSARHLGFRVRYEPESEVIHFEHKTYSATKKNTHKILSNQNKARFLEKWHTTLAKQHTPRVPWYVAMSQAERAPCGVPTDLSLVQQHRILFYTPDPPLPHKHGNRVRMCGLIRAFQNLGHHVHVVILNHLECTDETIQSIRDNLKVTVDVIPAKPFRVSLGRVPFDGWYEKGMGEFIRCLCSQYAIDVVLCSYVFQSKLLDYVPSHSFKIIDMHDKMAHRADMLRANQLPITQFSCSLEEERAYLKRADKIIAITPEELDYVKQDCQHPDGVMISHLEEPRFLRKNYSVPRHVGIVASNNRFNIAMIRNVLKTIEQEYPDADDISFTLHIIGDVKKSMIRHGLKRNWIHLHGYVENLSDIYDRIDIILSPMMCGTGINIKTVEALAYGMPLLTTRHGARGIETTEPMHQHPDLLSLVKALGSIHEMPDELNRLSRVSQEVYTQFYQRNQRGIEKLFLHGKLDRQGVA